MSAPEKTRKSSARPVNRATLLPPADASLPVPVPVPPMPPAKEKKDAAPKREEGKGKREKTQPKIQNPTTQPQNQEPSLPPDVTVLHALRDIPGLGPIRIRALEKAGLSSLYALRAATLEQLLAVPGMSDIKARYIQTFLANATLAPEEEKVQEIRHRIQDTREKGKERREQDRGEKGNEHSIQNPTIQNPKPKIQNPEPSLPLWHQETERVCVDVVALLTCPPAPDFRARLLRELVRFAAGTPAWMTGLAQADAKDQERALRRVRRLQEALTESLAMTDLDRKTQARLAEDLADASDRLYALSGQIEPARKSEDAHD
jgi:Helix-hairpin-helix domain